jgi:phosphoribosylaminoimidazolecarboxamide formyltransferase/IMP cyclohydrolase
MGANIYATSGTRQKLEAAGVPARSISDLTDFPEILGGRVKTLHPGVHSGILARRDDPTQMAQLSEHGLREIHLVVVNLYPFAQTISRDNVTLEEAVEQIDVGGPTMIRAAAKNFPSVVVLSDPADYVPVISEWRESGEVSHEIRRRLAASAFKHVSEYDTLIAEYLAETTHGARQATNNEGQLDGANPAVRRAPSTVSDRITVTLDLVQPLKYGENPHQSAGLYRDDLPTSGPTLVGSLKQLHGGELSYNNLFDADAALSLVRDYSRPAVAIIKHAGPCGVACGDDANLADIFIRALASDPQSAFGGIVGINRRVDPALAEQIAKTRFDLIVAPEFSPEAIELLARKKSLRLLAVADSDLARRDGNQATRLDFRQVSGGFLVQTSDTGDDDMRMEPATLRHPTLEEIADMSFAWRAVRHVKSNAIVLARNLATVGIGGGQPSRVDSVKIAVGKADWRARGAVMASDAFFPFPDGIQAAADAGVTAVIQPGGSVNDDAVIEAADIAGMAMVFTGKRHFRH